MHNGLATALAFLYYNTPVYQRSFFTRNVFIKKQTLKHTNLTCL